MQELRKAERVVIRPWEEKDARPIALVGEAAWRAAYRGLMPDALIELWTVEKRVASRLSRINEPRRRTWVVERDGRIIGYSSSGLARDEDPPPERGEIYSCYIHPDEWRSGYGRAMVEEVLADMVQRSFTEVVLWCLAKNHQARRFYEGLGFEVELDRVAKVLSGFVLDHTRYRIDPRRIQTA